MPQGLNAGDALLIAAHRALLDVQPRLTPEIGWRALAILDGACCQLCEGQYLDILWESVPAITVDQYFGMVKRKTARLFACAAELGALCSGAGPTAQSEVSEFARLLGLAFQVADDILGVWSPQSSTGKIVAEDVASRKKALPATLALARPVSPGTQRLRQLYSQDQPLDEADIAEAIGIFDELGVREEARALVGRLRDEALEHLSEAAPPARLAELLYLVELALPGY
jgi:geranylgeranyl diphosphate synthase type I